MFLVPPEAVNRRTKGKCKFYFFSIIFNVLNSLNIRSSVTPQNDLEGY